MEGKPSHERPHLDLEVRRDALLARIVKMRERTKDITVDQKGIMEQLDGLYTKVWSADKAEAMIIFEAAFDEIEEILSDQK